MQNNLAEFSIKESLKLGWQLTKSNFSKIFTVLLILLLLVIAESFLDKALDNKVDAAYGSLLHFTKFALMILGLIMSINIIKQGLVLVRGGEADVKGLIEYPHVFFKFFFGQILTGIIVVLPVILSALIILLRISGMEAKFPVVLLGVLPELVALIILSFAYIAFFSIRLFFVKQVLVDGNLKLIESIKKSFQMTKGAFWKLVNFTAALLLLNLVGIIPVGLGLFVTLPISFFAILHVYNLAITSQNMAQQQPSNEALTQV